jgi:hypothetical protein
MTREVFIQKWRTHVSGLLSLGASSFRQRLKQALTTGAAGDVDALGEVLANIGPEADKLLGKLYDDMAKNALPERETVPITNGHKRA